MQHKKASSFLPSKNKAKIHLFRKFHVWQDYCINDKLTTFVPLCSFQPHIYFLIHAKFFKVLHTGGCWLFSEKQFLNQPISSFRLSDLAREWNTAAAQARGSGGVKSQPPQLVWLLPSPWHCCIPLFLCHLLLFRVNAQALFLTQTTRGLSN